MDALGDFRKRLYSCMTRRTDTLFELCDAIVSAGAVPSLPHLSLATVHRRGWGSLYAALSKGRIDENAIRDLLSRHPMACDDRDRTPVYAVDVTSWPRCDAECSPERGYYYHSSRHSAGQPIVAGWAYQLVAGIGFARDTWVAPVDVRRVLPDEDANDVAAEQVRALLHRTSQGRATLPSTSPLFVFDAGYDPVKLQRELGEALCSCLYGSTQTGSSTPIQKKMARGRWADRGVTEPGSISAIQRSDPNQPTSIGAKMIPTAQ